MRCYSYLGLASNLFRTTGRRWQPIHTIVERFPFTQQQPTRQRLFSNLKSLQPLSSQKISISVQKQSCVDFGISLNGLDFFTMIPKGSQLPCKRVETLTNVLDYDIRTSNIKISSRASILEKPAEIKVVTLLSNRKVKWQETEFKATMVLDEYLHGHFRIQDLYTNEEAKTEFDGWTAAPKSEGCILLPAPI
jgi:hypothetical protein